MKIKEMINQNRRDFNAIYVCEDCRFEERNYGYDDRNFHDNVIPKMKCKECGKSREDLGIIGQYIETKYPEGFQI